MDQPFYHASQAMFNKGSLFYSHCGHAVDNTSIAVNKMLTEHSKDAFRLNELAHITYKFVVWKETKFGRCGLKIGGQLFVFKESWISVLSCCFKRNSDIVGRD
jgi:hypothetical protein